MASTPSGRGRSARRFSAAGDSSYPDPKKTKLTDGVEATADYLDAPWTAYSAGAYREFVIDLGEICSVSEVEFNNLSNDGIAAKMPGLSLIHISEPTRP